MDFMELRRLQKLGLAEKTTGAKPRKPIAKVSAKKAAENKEVKEKGTAGYTSTSYSEESGDYNARRLDIRLKMGNQGAPVQLVDPTQPSEQADELNRLDIQTESILGVEGKPVDIIPFEINVVAPGSSKFLYFRAHLDTLRDSFTGDWNETPYLGRAEKMLTYDGFSRGISFSFKIAAFTRDELLPLYKKLNHLAGSTAPTYGGSGAFMRGTYNRLTIGDYIIFQPGVMKSIDFEWDVRYPWEINLEQDTKLPRVAHILNVSCQFTPIHNFIPELGAPLLMNSTFYA